MWSRLYDYIDCAAYWLSHSDTQRKCQLYKPPWTQIKAANDSNTPYHHLDSRLSIFPFSLHMGHSYAYSL